jgi:hypothetical protein
MVATILIALAVAAAPTVLILATLFVLGSALAALADASSAGLVRPNPS